MAEIEKENEIEEGMSIKINKAKRDYYRSRRICKIRMQRESKKGKR